MVGGVQERGVSSRISYHHKLYRTIISLVSFPSTILFPPSFHPPLGTDKTQNVDVYCMHSAHDYIVSIWSTSSCPVHIKHSNRQLPRDRSMAVPQIERLTLKERGSEKRPYELHFSCYKFCMVMVVSDDLRGTLRWSKFQQASSPPRKHCSLYLHRQLHTTHATPPPTLYVCLPFLQSLDPPLLSLPFHSDVYDSSCW